MINIETHIWIGRILRSASYRPPHCGRPARERQKLDARWRRIARWVGPAQCYFEDLMFGDYPDVWYMGNPELTGFQTYYGPPLPESAQWSDAQWADTLGQILALIPEAQFRPPIMKRVVT